MEAAGDIDSGTRIQTSPPTTLPPSRFHRLMRQSLQPKLSSISPRSEQRLISTPTIQRSKYPSRHSHHHRLHRKRSACIIIHGSLLSWSCCGRVIIVSWVDVRLRLKQVSNFDLLCSQCVFEKALSSTFANTTYQTLKQLQATMKSFSD